MTKKKQQWYVVVGGKWDDDVGAYVIEAGSYYTHSGAHAAKQYCNGESVKLSFIIECGEQEPDISTVVWRDAEGVERGDKLLAPVKEDA